MDAVCTWLRWVWGQPQIEPEGLSIPHQIERDLMPVLIDMRLEGAPVNMDRLYALRDELSDDLVQQEGQLYLAAGTRFNINSVPQKQQILYGTGDVVIQDKTN